MKIYDFDGMFDKKIAEYIAKNPNKKSSEEWEDSIPKLYEKFSNTTIKTLGFSPKQYYKSLSDFALLKTVCAHFKQNISVPQTLTEEIENRNLGANLLPLLSGSDEQILYALNIIGNQSFAINCYFEMLCNENLSKEIKGELCELLKNNAEKIKHFALEKYAQNVEKELMLELISFSKIGDENVFNILVSALRSDRENLHLHAKYLVNYGDERAVKYLLEIMEEEGLSFADFIELKYAVEALGGNYLGEKDFSSDPYYSQINSKNEEKLDLFKNFENK